MSLHTQAARQIVELGDELAVNRPMSVEEIRALLAVQQAIINRLHSGTATWIEAHAVLQLIADEARRLTACEMSAVYLLNGDNLEGSVFSGLSNRPEPGWQMPVDGSIAGAAVRSGQTVWVQDALAVQGNLFLSVVKFPARSCVIAPLMSAVGALGVILLASSRANHFDGSERQLLMMLAPGAVIAVQNARLYEQAQQAAALKERQRLARELHDVVTQTLFSASLIADVLPRLWSRDPQEGQARLDELRSLTRGALAEMRSLLAALDPTSLMDGEKE